MRRSAHGQRIPQKQHREADACEGNSHRPIHAPIVSRRVRGPRLRLHHRPRQRGADRRDQGAGVVRARPHRTAEDMGALWKRLVHDSQLRWLGPEKGVMHMAICAVVNALWDLEAKRAGKPLWQLLAEHVARGARRAGRLPLPHRRADPGGGARHPARRRAGPRGARARTCASEGYPAYTTTPGWLGYGDDKLRRLCQEAIADGFTQIKLKVGADLEDDIRRLRHRPRHAAARTSPSRSTPTSAGTSPTPSPG